MKREPSTTPAAQVEADSLLARSRARAETPFKEYPLPRAEGVKYALVVLYGDAIQLCHSRAQKRFDELGLDRLMNGGIDFEAEVKWQICWESMRDPANHSRHFAADCAETREYLTEDEREYICDLQLDLQDEYNPDLDNLTPLVAMALLEAVKKKDEIALSDCDSRTLRFFLRTLGELPEISQISPSSIFAVVTSWRQEKTQPPS